MVLGGDDIPNSATSAMITSASQTDPGALPLGSHSPGGLGAGMGYEEGDGFRLSAKTCLAILHMLTDVQLDEEIKLHTAYNPTAAKRTRFKGEEEKRDFLRKQLNNTFRAENDRVVNNFHLLLESISDRRNTETCAQIPTAPHYYPSLSHSDAPHKDLGNAELPVPVSFSDVSFEYVQLQDIMNLCAFPDSRPGSRASVYYGKLPYTYGPGPVKHSPAPYPSGATIFDTIFEKIALSDAAFTPDNYSCLVTLYRDGKCYIPLHADNEVDIERDSNIYTVSFGSTRTLNFLNEYGKIRPTSVKLEHGSVYIMSHESQKYWKHEIRPEHHVEGARVSFTFRHMRNEDSHPLSQPPHHQHHF